LKIAEADVGYGRRVGAESGLRNALAGVQVAFAGRYGYHRDELHILRAGGAGLDCRTGRR
jgi:hypothetical protein